MFRFHTSNILYSVRALHRAALLFILTMTSVGSLCSGRSPASESTTAPCSLATRGRERVPSIAVDAKGNVYMAANNCVVRVEGRRQFRALAAMTPAPPELDPRLIPGPGPGPAGLAVNPAGEVFFSDYVKNQVLKISADGVVTVVAGIGSEGFFGDGGPAVGAKLSSPMGLALDADGNLYIADYGNSRVRKVSTDGMISTVVSRDPTFNLSHLQDVEMKRKVSLPGPSELAMDAAGNLYMAD